MSGLAATNIVIFVAVAALIVLTIVRRMTGMPVQQNRLLLLPGILTVIGVVNLSNDLPRLTTTDVVLLMAGAVVSFGVGALRGATTRVYAKDGIAFLRYTWVTVVFWLGMIPVRIGLIALAKAMGAPVAGGADGLWLLLGITFAAEAMVVLPKARKLGVTVLSSTRNRARQLV